MRSTLAFLLTMMVVVVVATTAATVRADNDNNKNEADDKRLVIQHSLDGGKSWIDRGRLDLASLEFDPIATKWEPDQLARLRALAQKKGDPSVSQTSVFVRAKEPGTDGEVHTSVAVSPCALVVPRQYQSALTYIAERYGVVLQKKSSQQQQKDQEGGGGAAAAVVDASSSSAWRLNSLRLLNPFHDEVCEPTIFKTKTSNNDVKLKMAFVRAPVIKGMSLPFSSGGQSDEANVHDSARPRHNAAGGGAGGGGGGGDKKENAEENKSFWEKYGTYIMIFFAVQALSGLFAPKGKEGGGEGGGKEK